MKKHIAAVIAVWIISLALLLVYTPESDRSYIVELNRLSDEITRLAAEGFEIPPELFEQYNILPEKQNRLPLVILVSLAPLIALFALIKTQKDILKPLRSMSEIPGRLAKGHYQYNTPQFKSKVLHPFLWGLDMLRARLDEQKNINLDLEKERKTMVAGLSHDIKTPLSSIKTYSTAIKDGVYSTEHEVRDALDVILDKAAKIERLTDELLASSVNAIEEVTADASGHYLSELFTVIDQTVRNRIGLLKMEYNVMPLGQEHLVLADVDRLVEVCDNIVENAVKYGDLGCLSVRFSKEGQHILISFENTGSHIPEAEIKHIFTGFYRGSNVGRAPGHGLGLYIANKIMRAMEGDIYAENTDRGVDIVLVLKLV